MNNRPIKFRVYLGSEGFIYPDWIKFHKNGPPETLNHFGGVVQQFTGLLDSGGKEIYEGDIVEFRHGLQKDQSQIFVVIQDNFYFGGFAFSLDGKEGLNHTGYKFTNAHWNNSINDNYRIIGNIFENKDLLDK